MVIGDPLWVQAKPAVILTPAISLEEAMGPGNVESYDLQVQVFTLPLRYFVFDSRGTNLCDKSQRLNMHT